MVTLVATGWVSLRVVRLERERIEEARRAKVEENVSLALWRIDSLVAPLVAIENARPFQEYGLALQNLHPQQSEEPKLDNRYFTVELLPGVGDLVQSVRPIGGDVPGSLREPSQIAQLMAELPKPTIQLSEPAMMQFASPPLEDLGQKVQQTAKPSSGGKIALSKSATRSGLEYQARQSTLNRAMSNYMTPVLSQQQAQVPSSLVPQAESDVPTSQQAPTVPQAPSPYGSSSHGPMTDMQQQVVSPSDLPQVVSMGMQQGFPGAMQQMQGIQHDVQPTANRPWNSSETQENNDAWAPMRPVCVGDQLLLLRRVELGGRSFLQGCLLDWLPLARFLEKEVADLLPDARLVLDDKKNALGRMLASLPVRLEPGLLPATDRAQVDATLTPVLASVAVAFGCVLLSIGAFAVLLLGMIRLGRRRSEFVTAVTHELRTPLTTFRMYSEMLAEGMVPPESQKSYLQTLESESDRLTHLVENVLSSARLERGRHAGRLETLSLNELITPIASRLTKRCERARMRLDVQMKARASETKLQINPLAVEQILWNLVDNACKYAASAEDRTIRLTCEIPEGGGVAVTVSDFGPGLSRDVRRRLFCGFSKTASEAARSAPGVGLGLALSRRLARDLGGDLEFIPRDRGACFRLTLKTVSRSG